MNFQQLEYFRLVAQMENYTRAAQQLGITQSSISHAIANLEKELGVSLFDKQGRAIRLSQNGREFYSYVSRGLAILDEGKAKMLSLAHKDTINIRIGHVHNAARDFVAQAIGVYRRETGRQPTFELEQGATVTLLEAMHNKKLDLALTSKIESQEAEGQFQFVPVYEEEMVLVVPKQHRLAGTNSAPLAELDGEGFIAYDAKSGLRKLISNAIQAAGARVRIVDEELMDSSVCRMVSMGKAVAIVPNTMDLTDHDLVIVPLRDNPIRRFVYLCWCTDRPLPEPIMDFIRFVASRYGKSA